MDKTKQTNEKQDQAKKQREIILKPRALTLVGLYKGKGKKEMVTTAKQQAQFTEHLLHDDTAGKFT